MYANSICESKKKKQKTQAHQPQSMSHRIEKR